MGFRVPDIKIWVDLYFILGLTCLLAPANGGRTLRIRFNNFVDMNVLGFDLTEFET
jgi:hypothetical protein